MMTGCLETKELHEHEALGSEERRRRGMPLFSACRAPRLDSRLRQPTAFLTSAAILASTSAVSSVSAKSVGHMAPSSRFASSLKPSVAYRDLNLSALLKKQTTLPSWRTRACRTRCSERAPARSP